MSDETYTCGGCAGEVSVVEAIWLPEPKTMGDRVTQRPYCCRECFDENANKAEDSE